MLRDYEDSFKFRCLDAPPLAQLCPELVAGARPLVDSVAHGTMDAAVTMLSLEQMVAQFREAAG